MTEIRRLVPADAAAYRALMLRLTGDDPASFTSTVAERAPLPLAWWAARLEDDPEADERVYGAVAEGRLAGVAGLRRQTRAKTRHKATLFGMGVLREHRRRGLARALVEAVVAGAEAMPGVCVLQLTVAETNAPARRLYEGGGFQAFGVEPRALRADDAFVGLVHMWRAVADGPP